MIIRFFRIYRVRNLTSNNMNTVWNQRTQCHFGFFEISQIRI